MLKNRYNKFKILVSFIYLSISVYILSLNIYNPKVPLKISYYVYHVFKVSSSFFTNLPTVYKKYINNINYIKELEKENNILINKINNLNCINSRVSIIENENKELKKLLLFKKNYNLYNLKNIISFPLYSINVNTHNAIINLQGYSGVIKDNLPVLTPKALLGRTIDTNEKYTKVLLITSSQSRIPVYTQESNIHAIIVGNNTPIPILISYDKEVDLKEEEILLTSGLDGIFPRNIPVGTIFKINDKWFVKPFNTLDNIYYVQIICPT